MTIRELKGLQKPLVASVAALAIFSVPCISFAQEQSAPPSTTSPANHPQTAAPEQNATHDSSEPKAAPDTAQPSKPADNAQQNAAQDTAAPNKAPDNSEQNKAQQTTAQQQPENNSDRMTTKKIRKSIMADKSLSMYAHNVKIITQNGAVTLKGPVKSEEEKQTIASKAAEVVGGPDKVMNQLTVKQ